MPTKLKTDDSSNAWQDLFMDHLDEFNYDACDQYRETSSSKPSKRWKIALIWRKLESINTTEIMQEEVLSV